MRLKLVLFSVLLITLLAPTLATWYFFQNYQPSLKLPFNLLILGLDPRHDQLEDTQTTDTIIIAHFATNNTISLVSLPRDLWNYATNSKINQIYPQSLTQDDPERYIADSLQVISGQKIDRQIVITTDNLEQLIDIIGGVDVYLENPYTDTQYPNPEYIKNPSPKIPVYITISFPAGINHIDNHNISYFVRSRKGAGSPTAGGTDLGRIHRQQLLVNAILDKLKTNEVYSNRTVISRLYNLYRNDISTNLKPSDLFALILAYKQDIFNINLQTIDIPISEDSKKTPLYEPKISQNKYWAFYPSTQDYKSLHQYINDHIK